MSRSRLQQQPNEYEAEAQATEHYLECQNLIHWHFLLVQTLLHVTPSHWNKKFQVWEKESKVEARKEDKVISKRAVEGAYGNASNMNCSSLNPNVNP